MASSGRKLTTLTLKQKFELLEEVEHSGKKKVDIAREYGIPRSTLSGIIKHKDHYRKLFCESQINNNRQRARTAACDFIDTALLKWFTVLRSANVPVNGPLMMAKAEEFAVLEGKTDWKCSVGWLDRFKKRHCITYKSVCGERQSVDEATTLSWTEEVLKPTLAKYKSVDVFNADETGLFWRLLPDKTFSFKNEKCYGGKKSKERITVVVCSNMDGSEKWPLFVIGKFKSPRCFKGLKKLCVNYRANSKAWMTSELFSEWLQEFDSSMFRKQRKVLLIVDNCSAHTKVNNLKATVLLFLPPNATSILQPCDQGIIQNLKVHYRSTMLSKLVCHMDADLSYDDFHITLLDAILMLKSSWDNVLPATIANCFRQAGFLPTVEVPVNEDSAPSTSNESKVTEISVEPLLLRLYQELNIQPEEFVNIDNDVFTSDTLSSTDIISLCMPTIQQTDHSNLDTDDDEDDCGLQSQPVSKSDVLACIDKINIYMMQTGCSDDVILPFFAFEQAINRHFAQAKKQSKITDFFFN
jgi:transposase-like protein/uncharacterized membrane protein